MAASQKKFGLAPRKFDKNKKILFFSIIYSINLINFDLSLIFNFKFEIFMNSKLN